MALSKEQKQKAVEKLQERMEKQKSAVFITFDGVKNEEMSALRRKLKENSADISIAKKTLAKLAFSKKGIQLDENITEGRLGIVFNYGEDFNPVKAVYDFSKGNKNFEIIGGFLENGLISKEEAVSLALIPSKEVLYSKIVSVANAPLSNFLSVCQGNVKGLINVLTKLSKA